MCNLPSLHYVGVLFPGEDLLAPLQRLQSRLVYRLLVISRLMSFNHLGFQSCTPRPWNESASIRCSSISDFWSKAAKRAWTQHWHRDLPKTRSSDASVHIVFLRLVKVVWEEMVWDLTSFPLSHFLFFLREEWIGEKARETLHSFNFIYFFSFSPQLFLHVLIGIIFEVMAQRAAKNNPLTSLGEGLTTMDMITFKRCCVS